MSTGQQRTKKRLGGISKIRKVTAAMHRVAATRLANDRRAMLNAGYYNRKLLEVLREVCVAAPDYRHVLLDQRRQQHTVEIAVFSSDFGMCGGFNVELMEKLQAFIRENPEQIVKLRVTGRIVGRMARRDGIALLENNAQPKRQQRTQQIDALAARMTQYFVSRNSDAAYILFSRDINGIKQEAVIEQLLPVPFEFPEGHRPRLAAAVFEPTVEAVLEHLLGEYVAQALDRAFLSSLASENAARRTAMAQATDNAAGAQREVEKQYRRIRQNDITREMLETGAEQAWQQGA